MKDYDFQSIRSIVKNLIKGQLGVCVVSSISCDKKLLASGRNYIGRIKKVTIVYNARLGTNFGNMVDKKGDGTPFTPSKPNGMTWIDFPYFKQADRSGEICLSINYRECDEKTKFESVYLLDGHLATENEIECFKQHFSKSGGHSKKQASVGVIDEREQTKVVQYNIKDIHYIGTVKADAEDTFNELTK